jgi:dipeptidyl aminopeptidase/acylaminoacyl peptidase
MRIAPLLLVAAVLAPPAAAQSTAASSASTQSAAGKPTLTPKDIAKWEQLGAPRLSPDGAWISYTITRGNEENDLRLRGGARDTTVVIPYGLQPAFAANSRWAASLVGIAPKEREKLTKDKKPVHNSFAAIELATGRMISIPDATSFAFSGDGNFVAVTKYAAEGKKVSDVIVLDLARDARVSFSNVGETAWNEIRPLLAYSVTTEGGVGNSVNAYDGAAGVVHVLESSPNVYRALSWRPKSGELAAMRTIADKSFADTAHVLLVWGDVGGSAKPRALESGVPAGARVSETRRPTWSRDGRTIYFGLKKREPAADAPKKSDEKVSDVEIWHTNDVHVIPEQRSGEQRDLRATMLAEWRADGKVVPIAADAAETTTILEGDAFAVETNRKSYAFGQKFGRRDEDVDAIDLATGARKTLVSKARFFYAGDPTGARVAQFDGKDYWAIDVATAKRTNLTAALKADFVDREDDHPSDVLPPINGVSWSKDGTRLLVYSGTDLWSLALDGSGGKRLTNGAGEGTQYRLVNFAAGGFGAPVPSAADRAVDLTKPVYLTMYGTKTKKSGYALLQPSGEVKRLVYADAQIGGLVKADSVARLAFVRQSFDESPNVYVAGADLADAARRSDTNPFQKDYAWGKAELMDFTSAVGRPLQAILYYPANYDSKKKYPMIVYTYELLSQGYHRYVTPRENDYYNANVFTQNGYFVLMPDIVFRPREPGIAVLHAVEPAVRAVIARGLVDPANIGHCGHSQGGYEAYYLATHSTLFKTAVAGAGITDMISFAGQMHWGSVPEFDHWETGQFRMQVAPWEDMAAMIKNSPLDKVQVMPAKSILMEIGGDDPTVDMRQGVEFYNYARRAGKDAVMLLYPGEGHGLGKKENAVDYERRILQWFGYWLKGDAPAKWITDGQTWLERKAILDANK